MAPSGLCFLKFMGKSSGIPGVESWQAANEMCDELNREAEAWRILRNKEVREASPA